MSDELNLNREQLQAPDQAVSRQEKGWPDRLAWLPIPVFLAAFAILSLLHLPQTFDPPYLLLVLNTIFLTGTSLLVVYLAARTYRARGAGSLLLMGCGMLSLGLGSLLSGAIRPMGDLNATVAIHNIGALLGGLSCLSSAVVGFTGASGRRPALEVRLRLGIAYVGIVGALTVLAALDLADMLPAFVIPGQGRTLLGWLVMGTAIASFGCSALLFGVLHRRSASVFAYWYALALGQIAVGLLGVLALSSTGTVLGWVGRAGQWLGGVYMFIASLAAIRESRAWEIPLERSLRESEEQFSLLVEAVKDYAIFMLDPEGRVASWNRGAQRVKGYSSQEILDQHFSRFYTPEDLAQDKPAQELAIARQRGQFAEQGWRVRKDGSRIWADVVITALRDEAGKVRGFLKMTRDITERKQAEEALASVARFPEENPQPVLRLSSDGQVLYINAAGLTLLRDQGWQHGVPAPAVLRRLVDTVLGSGEAGEFALPLHHGRLFSFFCAPVPDKGYANLYGQDVTERKQAEAALFESNQRLQALMTAVPVGISFSDDPTCQRITGNPVVLAQFDVAPVDNLSASAPDADAPGRQVQFFRDGRPVTDAELPLQRAVAENAVIAPMELEVLLPSGRRWFAEACGAPVHDAQGNVIGGIAVTADITERKQTEVALHAARRGAERYAADIEAVMNAVPAAVFITHDVECRHMSGNRVTQELLGLPANANFSKSARIHKRPTNFVAMKNGLEIPAYQLPVQVAARGQEVRNHEFDLVVEDGTVRTLLGDAVPLLNDSGQPYGAIGAFIDITARKWAEAALRLSEERYRLLAETMLQGVVHQDATGKIIAMNPSAERILGKGPAELQGHASVDEEYHTLREDGTPFPGLEHPSMVALRTGQPLADVVMGVFNPREEAYRWINISAVPVHRPGETQVCEVYTVFEDITERKRAEEALRESEERFRLFMDNSPTIAWVKDEQGRHVYLSKTYEDRFGVRLEEWRGKTDAELWPAETAEEFRKNDRAVLEARQPLEVTEETVSPDGSRSYWLNSKFLFRDAAGNRYVAGIGLDITERKQAEVALRRLNDELKQGMHRLSETNRELKARTQENEAFVYSVSHDLRSLLVNLDGFSKELSRAMQSLRADLLESDLPQPVRDRELEILDGPMAKATHFIQTAVTRLSSSIDALLRLSRAGRVVYQRRCVDVQAIVTRIIDSLRGTAEERGATIETGDLPAALGDPAAVEQIFANLIGNALNYLDRKRPGRIEVGSLGPEQDNAGAGLRTYYVRDNGLGITEAGRAKVFQPFQRLYPQAAPGEGMGLAIVHRVVERHGGRIWFESVANQGSTFFVALPAFPDEESPASPIPPACSETGNQPT